MFDMETSIVPMLIAICGVIVAVSHVLDKVMLYKLTKMGEKNNEAIERGVNQAAENGKAIADAHECVENHAGEVKRIISTILSKSA